MNRIIIIIFMVLFVAAYSYAEPDATFSDSEQIEVHPFKNTFFKAYFSATDPLRHAYHFHFPRKAKILESLDAYYPDTANIRQFSRLSLGYKSSVGFVNIMPQISYSLNRDLEKEPLSREEKRAAEIILAIFGETDALGFETFLAYQNLDISHWEAPAKPSEINLYGLYGNFWANIDIYRIGFMIAYGSWNETAQQGYEFGNNFEEFPAFHPKAPFMLNRFSLSPREDRLSGMILGRIYGELAVGEHLNLMPSVAYLTDHLHGIDSHGYEINLAADYSISDILTFSAAIAFSKTESTQGVTDSEINQSVNIIQRLELKF